MKWIFILFLSLSPSLAFSMLSGAACLHPIEQAALFHGNKKEPLDKQIEALEKKLEAEEEKRDKYVEGEGRTTGLNEVLENLSASLDDNEAYNQLESSDGWTGKDAVALLISDYMESAQDELAEEEKAGLPWESNHKRYFKKNGKISDTNFCKDFAKGQNAKCKEAFKELKKVLDKIKRIDSNIEKIEERLEILDEKRDFGEEESEGDGLCFECLDEVRALDRPSNGQVLGSALSVLAGGALSYYGYKTGKQSAIDANTLRIQQGYSPLGTANAAWAGASLGLPFISQGIYGLAGGNSQFGSYACNNGTFGGNNGYHPFTGQAYGNMGGPLGGIPGMGNIYGSMNIPGGNPLGGIPGMGNIYGNMNIPGGGPLGGIPGMGNIYGNMGINPAMQAQMQAQMAQQQQYSAYMKFQQEQMQARMEAQQRALQQQQAAQQEWANRQQLIGSLTQEMYQIQQQIQMVAYGGATSRSQLGANNNSISAGFQVGLNTGTTTTSPAGTTQGNAKQTTPKPVTNTSPPDSSVIPIIDSR